MKKLFTILSIVVFALSGYSQNIAYDCSCSVYLKQKNVEDKLRFVYIDGKRFIQTEFCCVPLKGNLIIACDQANGVYLDSSSGGMYINNFAGVTYRKQCSGVKIAEKYNAEKTYQLSSQQEWPYFYNSNTRQISNIATAQEWSIVSRYGIPDTTIIPPYSVFQNDFHPYNDCKTGLSSGFQDCYTVLFDATGLGNDYYFFDFEVNFPPRVYDYRIWPHKFTLPVKLSGDNILKNELQPPVNLPLMPITASANGNVITWINNDVTVNEFIVQRYLSNPNGKAGKEQGAPVTVPGATTYTDNLITQKPHWYIWSIRAKNCAGVSSARYVVQSQKIE